SSVPDNVYQLLEGAKTYPVTSNLLSDMLYYAIATSTVEELSSIQDITPDLARTIKNSLSEYEDFEQFIFVLKSKQFTYTRISRCLLHILLGIKNYNIKGLTSTEIAPYARVLGFRRPASVLLKEAKYKSKIPIITKMADAENFLNLYAYQMLSEDIFATSLYNRLVYQSFGLKGKHDIQTSPIIL
ncbi:MAG TPA: nucleotidyltransferase, partial [Lachnospiraceae bacterium]|nr:nucleotidyltransferase [Lachnospiraceae bacterium]